MGGLGPGIGGSEWFIIGLVALLVVGPERLPGLLRQLGKMVAKARGMANEFRSSFDEMARQSELDDLRKEVEALRTGQPIRLGADADAAFKDIKSEFDKPLFDAHASDASAMKPAASEWPDGEPVMMPIADAPLVAPELIEPSGQDVAVPDIKPRKRSAKAAEPANPIQAKAQAANASTTAPAGAKSERSKSAIGKTTPGVRKPATPKSSARKTAPRNSKLDL